ncbi:MAG TPA: hypothetical protein VHX37_03390 [Acidobacteriaceae bacterium]|jgi:hypothetical protein|nr:hypothetical protein [Acidobacteriaceae bacterium]
MLVRIARLSLIALAVALLAPLPAHAQKVPAPPSMPASTSDASSPSADSSFANGNPADFEREHMIRNMTLQRNKLRQKEIVDDSQQLLDLAKQLQDAVLKSNKDELSLSVVNTAAEIEKLAKSVKEKMRDGN